MKADKEHNLEINKSRPRKDFFLSCSYDIENKREKKN